MSVQEGEVEEPFSSLTPQCQPLLSYVELEEQKCGLGVTIYLFFIPMSVSHRS